MKPIILVPGTWGRSDLWHRPDSPLWNALTEKGFEPIEFLWSGYLGGFPHPLIVPPSTDHMKGDLMLWQSEGEKLALFCQAHGLEAPTLLTHSHGLQVGVFAAFTGQKFTNWLSLSGPVRDDMTKYRQLAKPNVQKWTEVVDREGDMVFREGEAFDGHHFSWQFDLPEADNQIEAPGQGHSGLTLDVEAWESLGLWKALT